MSCEQWRPMLAQAAEEEPDAPAAGRRARLAAHLERCAACRTLLAEQRAVRRALAARPAAPAPAGFAARVSSQVQAGPRWTDLPAWQPADYWRAWTCRLAPVAAGLLVVTFLTARDAAQSERSAGVPELAEAWVVGGSNAAALPAFALLGEEGVSGDLLLDAVLSSTPDEAPAW